MFNYDIILLFKKIQSELYFTDCYMDGYDIMT